MYLWNLDATPLSIEHIVIQKEVQTTDENVKYIFENLLESAEEKPFEEWNAVVSIDEKIELILPKLSTATLEKGTYYKNEGVYMNGIFMTQSLDDYRKKSIG